jgi:hypothetical protein
LPHPCFLLCHLLQVAIGLTGEVGIQARDFVLDTTQQPRREIDGLTGHRIDGLTIGIAEGKAKQSQPTESRKF